MNVTNSPTKHEITLDRLTSSKNQSINYSYTILINFKQIFFTHKLNSKRQAEPESNGKEGVFSLLKALKWSCFVSYEGRHIFVGLFVLIQPHLIGRI